MAQTALEILQEPLLGERENILKDAVLEVASIAGPIIIGSLGQEELTGRLWLDSRPVYRQTFSMDNPGIGDIVLPHGIAGLDLIISGIEGYCTLANGTKSPLPVINHDSGGGGGGSGGTGGDSGNTINIIEWDATQMIGYIGSNYTLTVAVATLVFTIEYVKTA